MSSATSESILTTHGLYFSYNPQSQQPPPGLKGLDLVVHPGECLVVIGHSGYCRSTLANHSGVLPRPVTGTVWVKGVDTRDQANVLEEMSFRWTP